MFIASAIDTRPNCANGYMLPIPSRLWGNPGTPGQKGKMTHCYTVEIQSVNNWFLPPLHEHLRDDLDDPGPSGKSSHKVM